MDVDVERPPKTFKSTVWVHFGFVRGDKSKVTCLKCKAIMKYSGNTTNMAAHLKRHHPDSCSSSATVLSSTVTQPTLEQSFSTKFHKKSNRATQISEAIGELLVDCLLPYSLIENKKFRQLLKILEPRYTVPGRKYFSDELIPSMYNRTKSVIKADILNSYRLAITTDGWTSRATQSYVTVTGHYIDLNWELCNAVLQTRLLDESHTGENISNVLIECGREWGFKTDETAIVSDNASNMTVAAKKASFPVHVKCLAHTLNLASHRALSVSQVSRLLGRIRKIVTFFHKSTTATAALKVNQSRLELPQHKLIMDVATRWNSSYEMLERFLEQQPAILATVMSKEIRSLDHCVSVSEDDISVAEKIVTIMKPVKTATTVLCSEKSPTVSLIYPLHHQLLQAMSPVDGDGGVIRDLKMAFHTDLIKRYSEETLYFATVAALDPRFKSLPFSSGDEQLEVFSNIATEAVFRNSQVKVKKETENEGTGAQTNRPNTPPDLPQLDQNTPLPVLPTLPENVQSNTEVKEQSDVQQTQSACALTDLFPDTFITKVEPAKPVLERANSEIIQYRAEPLQPLSENPLQWWKLRADKYPLLSSLAKYHLCVPATSVDSVPSERVFSKAGQIVSDRRALIKPKHVDYLIFLNKNTK